MTILVLFWTLTLVGCGYAAAAGGKDGRWAALLILSASMLSIPAILLGRHWHQTEYGVMVVDAGLLAGLYALSLRTTRYYPLWMTGFQLVAVATHIGTLLAPDFIPRIYRATEGVWAIPTTLVMIFGIMMDRRTLLPTDHLPSPPTHPTTAAASDRSASGCRSQPHS